MILVFAAVLFLIGFYEAYKHEYKIMLVFFAAMAFTFAIGMRGRNTWIQ